MYMYNSEAPPFIANDHKLCTRYHLFHSLSSLSACIESLQKLLVAKGVTAAVLETLREYIGEMTRNEQCVEYGCRALRGILMHP